MKPGKYRSSTSRRKQKGRWLLAAGSGLAGIIGKALRVPSYVMPLYYPIVTNLFQQRRDHRSVW